MMSQYDKERSGTLFPNMKKQSDKSPDFTGSFLLNGMKWSISAWNNAEGRIGFKVKEWEERGQNQPVHMTATEAVKRQKQDAAAYRETHRREEEETNDLPF